MLNNIHYYLKVFNIHSIIYESTDYINKCKTFLYNNYYTIQTKVQQYLKKDTYTYPKIQYI